jgi:hypothetical protein
MVLFLLFVKFDTWPHQHYTVSAGVTFLELLVPGRVFGSYAFTHLTRFLFVILHFLLIAI